MQQSPDSAQGQLDLLEPERDAELTRLLTRLDEGELTRDEQVRLGKALPESGVQLRMMVQHQSFSGPLPHPAILNGYDQETRKLIVQMAVNEQSHTHSMQQLSLTGAIEKDKRGQRYGLAIALAGFVTAGVVAFVSPPVAGVIAGLDVLGMVSVFVIPRAFERFGPPGRRDTADDETEEAP